MIIVRTLQATRKWLTLGILGLLPLMGGCDDNKSDKAAPSDGGAKQEAERAAREKAYGAGGNPNPKAAAKPAVKPAEKPAEK